MPNSSNNDQLLSKNEINDIIEKHEKNVREEKSKLVNALSDSINNEIKICKTECNDKNQLPKDAKWRDKINNKVKKQICKLQCDRFQKNYQQK